MCNYVSICSYLWNWVDSREGKTVIFGWCSSSFISSYLQYICFLCNHSFITHLLFEVILIFLSLLGSLCSPFSTRCYQLPVMDSIFVRKCQRGKGFGLQMLEDFVLNFKDDYLGLRYPLSKSMYKGTWIHPAGSTYWSVQYHLLCHIKQSLCFFIELWKIHYCKFNTLLCDPSVWKVPLSVPWRHRTAVGGRKHWCTQPED